MSRMLSYFDATDVKALVDALIGTLSLFYLDKGRIYCVRSKGSKTPSTLARIHPFPTVYQKVLKIKPTYIIEVISENFDDLAEGEKERVLIHELLHIPRSFSGGLSPHRQHFTSKVEALYRLYRSRSSRRQRQMPSG